MHELSDSPGVGGAGVQRHRETVERHRELGSQDQLRRLNAKWEFCKNSVDAIIENAQVQPEEIFSQEEIYPNLPLAITAFVSNIFGFSPKEPLVETTALMETLMESASSWSPTSAQRGAYQGSRERVPA